MHVSEVWEDLARESTARLNIGGISWKPAQRWWGNGKNGKAMEIDVIAESFDEKMLLFGEAKWEEKSNSKALFEKLDYYVDNFPHVKNRKVFKAIWLKKCQKDKKTSEIIIVPEDIIETMK